MRETTHDFHVVLWELPPNSARLRPVQGVAGIYKTYTDYKNLFGRFGRRGEGGVLPNREKII